MKQNTFLKLKNWFNTQNFYIIDGAVGTDKFLIEVGNEIYMIFKSEYDGSKWFSRYEKLVKKEHIDGKEIYLTYLHKSKTELEKLIYDRDTYKVYCITLDGIEVVEDCKLPGDCKARYSLINNTFLECSKEDILYLLSTNKTLEEKLTELRLDRKQKEPIYYIQEKVILEDNFPTSVLQDVEILWFKLKTSSKTNLLFGLKIENRTFLKGGYIYINDSWTETIKITDTITAIPYSKFDRGMVKSVKYITEGIFVNDDVLNKATLCFGTDKNGKIIPIKCNIENRKMYNLDVLSHFNGSYVKRYLKKELDEAEIVFSKQVARDEYVYKYVQYCFGNYDLDPFDAVDILKAVDGLGVHKAIKTYKKGKR